MSNNVWLPITGDLMNDLLSHVEQIKNEKGLDQLLLTEQLTRPTQILFDTIYQALQDYDRNFPTIAGAPPHLGSEMYAIALVATYRAFHWRLGR